MKRSMAFLAFVFALLLFCTIMAPASADPGSPETTDTPAVTSSPESTATLSPEPTAAPSPESTETPLPEFTETPLPESTAAPSPESTETPAPDSAAAPSFELAPGISLSYTTGLPTTSGYRPINIQIENAPGARPQAGMSQADIVYECFMENRTVTRFQCVFNDHLPTYVGPVRSCRVYFVDIAEEYKGILAFYGGPSSGGAANINPKIARALSSGNLQVAANGLASRAYNRLYWRIKTRRAPHNVYTNLTNIVKLYTKPPEPVNHFLFNAGADYSSYENINSVEVEYRGKTYDTKYVYNPAAQNYKRYVGGKAFTDANTRKQITVKNIIVQRAPTVNLGTKKGHINIVLIGSGKADVFVKGKRIKATWRRPTEADITKYYDESGNEIPLQPGNTWVQEVPDNWSPHVEGNAILYSTISASLNVKVGTPAPVAASPVSYNSIKVSWGKAAEASRYELYRATSAGGTYKLLTTTTGLSYTNKSVNTGTTYYYKARAYHLVGKYKVYGSYSNVVSAAAPLSVPGTVKAAPASYNSIKVSWGKVAGATRYELYRSTASDGVYSLVTATSARSCTNKKVNTGAAYFYKVRAYRLVGRVKVYGGYSAVVSATTSIAKPAHVRATRASSTSIRIRWNAVAGATKYEIWRSPSSGGTYELLAAVGSANYTNAGLVTGTYYYYKVIAYRTVGAAKVYGGYSSVVHAKP